MHPYASKSREEQSRVPTIDSTRGIFTFVGANQKTTAQRCNTSATTLCFVRGTGKIAIGNKSVEYGNKWFEVPRSIEYQIFPETDTVMLTFQKSTGTFRQ